MKSYKEKEISMHKVFGWAQRGLLATALVITGATTPGFAQEEYGPPSIPGKSERSELRRNKARQAQQKPNVGSQKQPPAPPLVIPEGMMGPVSYVATKDHSWGTILQGTMYEHTFQIENKGDMVLKITNVKPG